MVNSRERDSVALLDESAERHQASGVWGLISGGNDSLANTLVTSQARMFRGCLHIDTGIGIDETREFVRETCRAQGWPLKVYRAADCGQDYDALAIRYGFPGPGQHFRMYIRLKERALNRFIREHKTHRHDRLVLSTGARSQESARRMGHVEPERREGVKVWVNPLHDWSKLECREYIESRGVPQNPVVALLHMSGECLCGAFAHPGELDEIALWYPQTAERIRDLETRVKEAGKPCIWGVRPVRPKQSGDVRDSAGRKRVSELCQQCELFTEEGQIADE